jgi:hypothetical protein
VFSLAPKTNNKSVPKNEKTSVKITDKNKARVKQFPNILFASSIYMSEVLYITPPPPLA